MTSFEWKFKDRRESEGSVTTLETPEQTMRYSRYETVGQVQVLAGEEYLYFGLC